MTFEDVARDGLWFVGVFLTLWAARADSENRVLAVLALAGGLFGVGLVLG